MPSPDREAHQEASKSVESRLTRLETQTEILVDQVRELRSQIMKIRTTDFRILVGLIVTSNLAMIAAIAKLMPGS